MFFPLPDNGMTYSHNLSIPLDMSDLLENKNSNDRKYILYYPTLHKSVSDERNLVSIFTE